MNMKAVLNKTIDGVDTASSAVVKITGRQHLVHKGLIIESEKIDAEVGTELIFKDVLLYTSDGNIEVGKPILDMTVKAKVIEHYRDRKVIVFKKLRRHVYQRKHGHRQNITKLEITFIGK